MTISKIKRIGSTNRFHVYADDVWAGIFLDEILAKYHLKTDGEIDDEVFKEIKVENDQRVSFDMAVSYLEKYVVSQKGLCEYLKKKGFDANVISATVEKLKEYGLVDDEKFAKNCFESLSSSKGKRAIALKLRQKGVANDIVDEILQTVDEDVEFENACRLADKFVKNRQKDTKTKQKCVAHLIYKGYDISVAQKAASKACLSTEEENDWL